MSFVAHGVSYDASFVTSAARVTGYLYIVDIGGSNPYYTLSSLFGQTVTSLASVDGLTTSTTSTTSSSTKSAADPRLTVTSQDTTGATITGYWSQLTDQSIRRQARYLRRDTPP